MPSKRKFYRTVIQVEILSEDPYLADELEVVDYDITDGECSGNVTEVVRNQTLSGPEAAAALQAQASDPGFFRLTEDGEDTDPEEDDNSV